jgi:hypothetical protein
LELIVLMLKRFGGIGICWKYQPKPSKMRAVALLLARPAQSTGQRLFHIVATPSESYLSGVHEIARWNIMKAQEFDEKFEAGEDLTNEFDCSLATVEFNNYRNSAIYLLDTGKFIDKISELSNRFTC